MSHTTKHVAYYYMCLMLLYVCLASGLMFEWWVLVLLYMCLILLNMYISFPDTWHSIFMELGNEFVNLLDWVCKMETWTTMFPFYNSFHKNECQVSGIGLYKICILLYVSHAAIFLSHLRTDDRVVGLHFFFAAIHVFFFCYICTSAYVSVSPLMILRTNARVVGLYFAVLQLHTSLRRADSPWARYNIYRYIRYVIYVYKYVCI